MRLFYNFFVYIYSASLFIAAAFNKKAANWVKGRQNIRKKIADTFRNNSAPIVWFHAASLGEFEQGRPLIEKIKADFPTHKIMLTFFSPSGYALRKNYNGADYVFYLPADTPSNARFFVKNVKPVMAIFIKYEFWFNYMYQLKRQQIPVFYVSAIFRPEHYFFRFYGKWALNRLRTVDGFFVQDDVSEKLLRAHGITSCRKSGDTRFDRVRSIVKNEMAYPAMKVFCANSKVLIAGSTWPEDDKLIVSYIQKNLQGLKYIIAPHEIKKVHVEKLRQDLKQKTVLFSELTAENAGEFNVLIVDSIGHLAQLYRYGHIAFIGGGFGKGIHNILEAACFGLPVIFGPVHKKFNEAVELIKMGGAFTVSNEKDFESITGSLLNDVKYYAQVSEINKNFVNENSGACRLIGNEINKILT